MCVYVFPAPSLPSYLFFSRLPSSYVFSPLLYSGLLAPGMVLALVLMLILALARTLRLALGLTRILTLILSLALTLVLTLALTLTLPPTLPPTLADFDFDPESDIYI